MNDDLDMAKAVLRNIKEGDALAHAVLDALERQTNGLIEIIDHARIVQMQVVPITKLIDLLEESIIRMPS